MTSLWPGRAGTRRPVDPAPTQSQHSDSLHHPRAGSTGRRLSGASRVPEPNISDRRAQIQADSSSSDEDLHPSRHPSRPRHRRSVSHPFPSLFWSGKKVSGTMRRSDESETDSAREPSSSSKAKAKAPPHSRGHRDGSSLGSNDFATGNCMTCGALVRWPSELQVFRCTICLTINDLEPAGGSSRREEGREETFVALSKKPCSDIRTISLAYTKALIDQSLRSFIASALKREVTRSAVDDHVTPAAPFYPPPEPPKANGDPVAPPAKLCTSLPDHPGTYEPRSAPGSSGEPPQRRWAADWTTTTQRRYSTSFPERRPNLPDVDIQNPRGQRPQPPPSPRGESDSVFKALEDYIVACITSFDCLNSSFTTYRTPPNIQQDANDARRRSPPRHRPSRRLSESRRESHKSSRSVPSVPDLDPKLLLLGDFAENGSWWCQDEVKPARTLSGRGQNGRSPVSATNPRIEWLELEEWYATIIHPAWSWFKVYDDLVKLDPTLTASNDSLRDIEAQLLASQDQVRNTLLRACETVLKRPGRRITEPHELRFLLIITANPLLHSSYKPFVGGHFHSAEDDLNRTSSLHRGTGPSSGRHSGIIKRIAGLISNAPAECHNHLVAWVTRYPDLLFVQTKDLFSEFLVYRLVRHNQKKYEPVVDITGGLIPSIGAGQSVASLHAALGHRPGGSNNKRKGEPKKIVFQEDWQIKAAAQVLGLVFTANNISRHARRGLPGSLESSGPERPRRRGQFLATSDFYVTLLDELDLVADFDAWERNKGRFSFCYYPFLLTIGSKIRILEYEARRQMESIARDIFFDNILNNRGIQQHLVLNIRRECLVEDSLKAVSEVVGGGGEDIKKGLKITFRGEEGVDAGGLRKEWFLLLVREVFNPDHGMFLYDEDSHYCYFNPNSLEPSEQFFLVGVVIGLAIYNSTILDVAFPPFAFRKLLLAGPPPSIPTSQPRQTMTYTLDDLAEYRPRLAHGLRQLLEYPGDDVESTFGLDFVIDTERYGSIERVALRPNGDRLPVTNANRHEYVDAYVRYLLDTAVSRQFEPFKRGFFTVCGGNALSLFRPDEIELLVRGSQSDEKLDVAALKAVAEYDGWSRVATTATSNNPAVGGRNNNSNNKRPVKHQLPDEEPTVRWFWEVFEGAEVADQRRLLAFITGSDRIPAMGAASLIVRLVCAGEDCGRFPTARTCFNTLVLYRYETRERLEAMLWRAVRESEGFGLK